MLFRSLLTNGTGYTYNSLTGLITIPSSSVTGDINIIADTFNITKTLTGLTATGASQGSSYSGGVVTTLSVAPTKIQVVVNNSTYTLKDGENITFDTTGVIGYSVSAKTVTVTGNSNNKNIEIIANYGVYSAEVSVVNMSNTAFASAVGGTDFSTTITPDRGYSYPTDIEVTVAGNRIMSGYSYDPITGIIIVDGLKITGNLRITAVGVPKTNMVTYNLEELTTDGSTTVTFGEDYTATLTPSIGYHLPDKIEVYLNEELITVGYTYDTSSGFVSIDGNLCDSSIRIKAKGELNQYAVTFKGTNVLIKEGTSGEKKASYHTTYETTLEAAPNYRLPNEIELSMDGKTLINNTDYSYNATTGELVVNNQVIEGDLKITVIGIDNSNPMAGIQIDDKIWDTNKDKLGVVYYNANKTVSFNYEDNSEDICEVSYFISESPVTEYEEIVWIDYDVNSPVVLEHDGRYYIYERVQDQTGNVTYVNSDAIIIDTIQPVLLDVMNGATYYDDILLEISEENLDYIEVDGNRIIEIGRAHV